VRAARARALPLACTGAAPPARLSARALTATAPPSGLVDVRVDWSVEWEPLAGDDVVTVSCAAAAHVADIVDYIDVPAGAREGNVTIKLPHATGCEFTVKLVRGGGRLFGAGDTATCAVAATVPSVRLGAGNDPVGTRIAFGDAAGDMIFTWASLDGDAPAVVRVGTVRGGPYTLTFTSTTPRTYRADDSCHAPASEDSPLGYVFPGYFHSVSLNLTAGTRYYAVYGQAGGTEAPETSFKTRPAVGPDVPVRFAAFGDAATYFVFPGTVSTVSNIVALDAVEDIDFVTNIGDLAYAEGSVLLWTFWTGLMWPLTSQLPFQVT